MMKQICIFLALLLVPLAGHAQGKQDRVELLRMSYINRQLQMSNAEAEKFWPIYNEYNDKVKAIRKNLRQAFAKDISTLSDHEAEQLLALDLQAKQAETDVHKMYSARLRQLLGTRRVVMLRKAEEDFKKEIIKTLRESSE